MKLEDMKTLADALKWALRRIDTAELGCGECFARAEEILNQQRQLPTEVICSWSDGSSQYMNFDHWPQREDLPAGAVCFQVAVPDPAVSSNQLLPH